MVQDLKIESHNIRYRLEHWVTPQNESVTGQLPDSLGNQHIGNHLFGWFQSTDSKSRINFLELLRAGKIDYYLSDAALDYMKKQSQ